LSNCIESFLIKKTEVVHVEVIDGQSLSSGNVTQETIPLETMSNDYNSHIVYNVIHFPSSPIILGLSWLEKYNPQIDSSDRSITFLPKKPLVTESLAKSKPISCKKFKKTLFIGARAFMRAVQIGATFAIYTTPTTNAMTMTSKLLEQYNSFEDVFEKKNIDMLPQHRPYNCAIDLEKGTQPPFGSIYNLLQNGLIALKQYVEENLTKNFIQHSKSLAGVPILFVKKKDGSLRMCVDYRGLNKVIVKNRYPLPLSANLLSQLNQAKIYTKIDLRTAYNLLYIKGDK